MDTPASIQFLGRTIPSVVESENEGIEVYSTGGLTGTGLSLWIWIASPKYFRYGPGPFRWVSRVSLDPASLVVSVEASGDSLKELEENTKKEIKKILESCKSLLQIAH
jgi:hypothetical protein